MWSVSYYVPAERYWQFAGEWENLKDAQKRAKLLEKSGHETRISKLFDGSN